MFRNCWRSLMYTMGLTAIFFIIISHAFPESIKINQLYLMVCMLIPSHVFSFFTLSLKLFSKRIWIRRGIVIAFYTAALFVVNYAFRYRQFGFDRWISLGIGALGFVITTIFLFYVADKIVAQNLKLINQKLSEKNTSNIE